MKNVQSSCLYYLYTSKGLTATELCERCEEDKATVSRSIDFLTKNGYIKCDSKTAKRYKNRITLTEKGNEIGEKISKKIDAVLSEIGSELTDEERDEFYRCLAIVSKDIDTISKRYNK